jgi:hypothetical protein
MRYKMWLQVGIVLALVLVLTQCSTDRELFEITIIPSSQTVSVGQTVQFKAMGNFTRSPAAEDITNQVTWSSTVVSVATIDATGLATGMGDGTTTIVATSTAGRRGTAITAQATLNVGATSLLGVVKSGTGTGTITSVPAGINCGATCGALFTNGTSVSLTATADTGSAFGTWSGCDVVAGNVCTVVISNDRIVTATFN